MSSHPSDSKAAVEAILQRYDTNKDHRLSPEEVQAIIKEYETKRDSIPAPVLEALKLYDSNADGTLDAVEITRLHHDIEATRYVAYAAMIARASRYLAFTSDLGEAFRPVVSSLWVRSAYGVSWAYCIGDVAYETRKASQAGVSGMELARLGTERAVFQAVASMAVPAFLIHSQVNIFKAITAKLGRGQRWVPTIAGLAVIPFLPLYLDEPSEKAIEWAFAKVWPTDKKHH